MEDCSISTGDDALCVKSGQDWAGRTFGVRSENILFRRNRIGHGHGLSVGSDMSAGVRNVTFEDMVLNGTTNGVRMKSQRGRGGVAEEIVYRNITMAAISQDPLQFTLNYHKGLSPTNATATPIFRNVLVEDVVVQGAGSSGLYDGLPESIMNNIVLHRVTIAGAGPLSACQYIYGTCEDVAPCPSCFH